MNRQHAPDESPNIPSQQAQPRSKDAASPDTRTPLYRAYNEGRYQRQEVIRQIQGRTGRRLICYVGGSRPGCGINPTDTLHFVDLLHNINEGESIDLLLHTIGGDVDAAEKLIRLVRSKVGHGQLRVVVPEFAKSAGTVMVLGADCVVMSDTSELGPIDPQMEFADSHGNVRMHSVQNYLDAYEEHYQTIVANPHNVASQIMLGKIDPDTVKLCQAVMERVRQLAESLLRQGMFRNVGNFTQTVGELLDTKQWLSHAQMISWEAAKHSKIGLHVEYLNQDDDLWQNFWRLYCMQRLAIADNQKLYESDCASLAIDAG